MVASASASDNGYSLKFKTVPLRLPHEHEQLFRDLIAVYRHLYERGQTAALMGAIADVVYGVQSEGKPVVLSPMDRAVQELREAEAAKAREAERLAVEARARYLEVLIAEQTEALKRAEENERLAREALEAEAEARANTEGELIKLASLPVTQPVEPGLALELGELRKRCQILSSDYATVATANIKLETQLGACQERYQHLAADLEFERNLRISVQVREAELEQENEKLRSQLAKLPAKPRASRAKKTE
jgi:hypothetical protein